MIYSNTMSKNDKGGKLFMEVLMIMMWVIIIFGAILLGVSQLEKNKEFKEKSKEYKIKWIQDNNITPTTSFSYENDISGIYINFIVDNNKKAIYISNGPFSYRCIPFLKIIGFETTINNQITGGVKRAIVGGILAGETGAVVGAVTAKDKIHKFQVVIYTNDISRPEFTITLINEPVNQNADIYKKAEEFAQKMNATIKAIIYQNSQPQPPEPAKTITTNKTIKKKPQPAVNIDFDSIDIDLSNVKELLNQGCKIKAIKEYKSLTGQTLTEAKDFVDGLEIYMNQNK